MSYIESKYNEHLDSTSGQDKVLKSLALFSTIYKMLAHQAHNDFPNLSDRELKRKVAERLYLSDSRAQELLRKVR